MVKLEELRAATDFLIASGELISITLIVRDADGGFLEADKLGTLKNGFGKSLLSAAQLQFKDVQTAVAELDPATGTVVVRLYAYGRLSQGKTNGYTAGAQCEV